MKVTKTDRVTALVDRTTIYEVPKDIWDELVEFHSCTPEEALDILVSNDDAKVIECVSEVHEVVAVHNTEIYEP